MHIKDHYPPPLAVRHGRDFAKHGIGEIWFALFPTSDKAKELEDILIPTVRYWNRQNKRDDILNRR